MRFRRENVEVEQEEAEDTGEASEELEGAQEEDTKGQ